MSIRFVPGVASGYDARTLASDRGHYVIDGGDPVYTYVPLREPADLAEQLAYVLREPKFSIVVPVYNTPGDLLQGMIASVESQWYPRWELILVDDCSTRPAIGSVLDAITNEKILVFHLKQNRGIAGATNVGISHTTGDFIVFLDHDDELTADCLYRLACCIHESDPDFIYSDEDKIDMDGSFTQPFFKPDWSPDTLMSTMYTCHVSCVRRTLAQRVGGLRSEYNGTQDWDFVLRITEMAQRIAHIPRVLYHWRIIPQSVASDLAAKPYAVLMGKAAREAALTRRGLRGELQEVPELPGYYRTRYALRGTPRISILIPSKNNGPILRRCVESIRLHSNYTNFELVIVDNGSTDENTIAYFDDLRSERIANVIMHDRPFNYSEINNLAVRHSGGEILVFLNDDTEVVSENWLDYMAGYAQQPNVGAVGAKLLYPTQHTIQHAGVVNLSEGPGHAFLNAKRNEPCYFARNLLEYDWLAVTGACMMLERTKFEAIGGFDEELPIAYNDVALCFGLAERGLHQVVCPGVELYHYESLSRGSDTADAGKRARLERDKAELYRKHPTFFMHDPYHNPNLAPDDVYFNVDW